MNLVVELPSELEAELESEALQAGLSLPDYVVRLVQLGRVTPSAPQNGSELIAYWQREGLVGSRVDIADASAHARTLRKQAETRERD